VCVEIAGPAGRAAELIWDLSTRAGRALAAANQLEGEIIGAVAVVLRQAGRDHATVAADGITRAGTRVPLRAPYRCPAAWTRERDLEHIDAEGLLRCTIRHTGGTRAIFAHTTLLALLGVGPGAYSLRAASVSDPD
jgi:hypothetical protein